MVSLISLPITDLTSPPLGIAQIKGYIQSSLKDKIRLFDASLDFFYYCLEGDNLNRGLKVLNQYLASYESDTAKEMDKYHFFFECNTDMDYIINNVEKAILNLKKKDTYTDWRQYERNLSIIARALRIFSLPYFPTVVTYQQIAFKKDIYSLDNVIMLASDTIVNPLIAFFEKNVHKYVTNKTRYVGVSISYSQQLVAALTLAKIVKEKYDNVKIVAGGSFFRSFSSETEKYNLFVDFFDAIIPDAGEAVWDEIIKNDSIMGVQGCWIKKDHQYYDFPGKNKLIERKLPDFSDFNLKYYLTPEVVLPYIMSVGCYWGKCTFCSYQSYKSNCIKSQTYDDIYTRVVNDLKMLHEKYLARAFFFVDEAIPPQIAEKLAKKIQKEQYTFRWFGEMRFDKVVNDEEFVFNLKQGGCELVLWGLESGNDRVLCEMNKGTNVKLINEILSKFKKGGIKSMPMFFLGFPTETIQEATETLRLLKSNIENFQYFGIGTFLLLKGSPVHQSPSKYAISIKQDEKGAELAYFNDYDVEIGMSAADAEQILNSVYQDSELKKFFNHRIMTWNHLLYLPTEIKEENVSKSVSDGRIIEFASDCSVFCSKYDWFNKKFDINEHNYIYNTTMRDVYEIPASMLQIIEDVKRIKEVNTLTKKYGHNIITLLDILVKEKIMVIDDDK